MLEGPVLGLDCSGDLCSAAVVVGSRTWEQSARRPGEQLKLLLPMALDVMREAGVSARHLTRVGVTVGPGSFTGLRLAITTAKTIAQIVGVPVTPLGTLEMIAWSMLEWAEPGITDVAVVTDARKGQVFAAAYRKAGISLQGLHLPQALDPPEAARWLRELEPILAGGSGFERYGQQLSSPRLQLAPAAAAEPFARHVAAAAAERYGALTSVDYHEVVPLYLRPPDVKPPRDLRIK